MTKKIVAGAVVALWLVVSSACFVGGYAPFNLTTNQVQTVAGDPDTHWIEGISPKAVAGDPDTHWIEGISPKVVAGDPDTHWIERISPKAVA